MTALARRIVTEVAPAELEFFQETTEALSLRDLDHLGRRRGDDPLAFGLVESAGVVITGIACGAAHEVVKAMAEDAGSGAVGALKRLTGRRRRVAVPAELSEERIAELCGVAARTAVLLGLPQENSDLLSQAVAQHLRDSSRPEG